MMLTVNLPDAGRVVGQDPNLGRLLTKHTSPRFHSANARVRSAR